MTMDSRIFLISFWGLTLIVQRFSTDATLLEARHHSICEYQLDRESPNGLATDRRVNCFLHDLTSAAALSLDVRDQFMFLSDIGDKVTYMVDIGRRPLVKEPILHGWGRVEGIAVDWLSKNIFWTDSSLQHVAVSRYDGSHRHIIIFEDISHPRGIAVHPPKGYLFWSDSSPASARIERTDMAGQSRTTLISFSLINPNGLTVDHTLERLYFVDSGTDNIESVDFDGTDRTFIQHQSTGDFFGVASMGNFLFVSSFTEGKDSGAISSVKNPMDLGRSGFIFRTVTHPDYSLDLAVNDVTAQPGITGSCGTDNGGCRQLCLPMNETSFQCSCGTGYQLNEDGVTCGTVSLKDPFILVGDVSLGRFIQVDAHAAYSAYSALPLQGVNPTGMAYDPIDSMVYWTDVSLGRVSRAGVNGTMREEIASDNVLKPSGIAIDPVRRVIYWTDEERQIIERASLDGGERDSYVTTELGQPRSVAVNPSNGDLFWSDCDGAIPKIERISEGGLGRKVLINSGLVSPNGIALDPQADLLYWCDARGDGSRIEVSSLEGQNRRVLVDLPSSSHPFALAIHGDMLFFTDWEENALSAVERFRESPRAHHFGPKIFMRMHGIASSYYALPPTPLPPAVGSNSLEEPPASVDLPTVIIASGGAVLVVLVSFTIAAVFLRQRTKARRRTTLQSRRPSRQPSIPIPPTPTTDGAAGPLPLKVRLPSDYRDPMSGEPLYMDLDNLTAFHASKGAPPPYSPPRSDRTDVPLRDPPGLGRGHVFTASPPRPVQNPAFLRSPLGSDSVFLEAPHPALMAQTAHESDHVFLEESRQGRNPSFDRSPPADGSGDSVFFENLAAARGTGGSNQGSLSGINHSYYRYQDRDKNGRGNRERRDSFQDTYNPGGDDAEYQTSLTPLINNGSPVTDYMDLSNSSPAPSSGVTNLESGGKGKSRYSIPSEYIEHNPPARPSVDTEPQQPETGNRVASNGVALRDDPLASSEAMIRRERERSRIEANLRRSGYTSP